MSDQASFYRTALQQEIIDLFNQQPLEKQPAAVIDVNCGDGLVLKEVFETIRDRTERGRHLERLPLRLFAVDDQPQALQKTARTLAGTKHQACLGDFNEPEKLNRTLEQFGLTSKQVGLQLRLFVDHLIAVDAEKPDSETPAILAFDQPVPYLDQQGQLLSALAVFSSWQQHFRRLANTIHNSRLLILEAHATPSQLMGDNGDNHEAQSHDVIHCMGEEYLISADAFLTLAASQGLFNDGSAKRYPKTSDPCRMSLHSLIKQNYIVRHATENDLGRLCELEECCWQHTRTSRDQLRSRLQIYPQGQFVLEKEGSVLGAIYTQRIAATDGLFSCNAADVHGLHAASGPIVQLLAVNIDPQAQNLGYGDRLLEFMLQRCSLMTGIEQVVGVTICRNYQGDDTVSFEQYIRQQGGSQDPILAFHQVHGAQIVSAISGYRPQDRANLGHGVLVVYDIVNRTPRPRRPIEQTAIALAGERKTAAINQREIGQFVHAEAAQLLGVRKNECDIDIPVMEMGLDSAGLLKLQQRLELKFGLEFGAEFFFAHNTVRKAIDYLAAKLASDRKEDSSEQVSISKEPERSAEHNQETLPGTASKEYPASDVAIIGMSCRLPGGIDTPEQLWQVLASQECVIGHYPGARGKWPAGLEKPGIELGGFIQDADAFDASFFRISPAEAQRTDPQQRILLQLAWACLEDATLLPATIKGTNTGVFIGASNCDYSRLIQERGLKVEAHHGVGTSLAMLANRLSYFFDLCGPSLAIDTACSSSLVALHTAIQSLRSGECGMALVGGVNVICHPDLSNAYHQAGMLAPDGKCKVFDASADGYVRSEGGVLFLLKPLRTAAADRDQIHGVIRGSAINHGGLAGGLTVPNPQKQSELLHAAWRNAGIAPSELSYIEAHGTGTPLGDPIEIEGIKSAYSQSGSVDGRKTCGIGSVKSNVGHLEAAAGVTGLLKVIVSMQHHQLPASINLTELNPEILLDGTPFYIQERLSEWDGKQPRVAAVSSFGSGGANAHVVVEEYPRKTSSDLDEGQYLFVLSATDPDRLRQYALQVMSWLENRPMEGDFRDALYSWQIGRTAMKQRLAMKVSDPFDLLGKLRQWLTGGNEFADVWAGEVESADSNMNRLWRSTSGQQLIDRALCEKNLAQLAIIWIAGTAIEWGKLYHQAGPAGMEPQRISLPTYPFAQDRYWVGSPTAGQAPAKGNVTALLHPLLHSNTSDLSKQRYSSTFTGEEFFLVDHQLRSHDGTVQKRLPGVAYLEMARAAIEDAWPAVQELTILELHNIAWAQPIIITQSRQISIALVASDSHQIDFEICSQDAEQQIVHCQGRAVWSPQPAPALLDIEQLKGEMDEGKSDPNTVYAAFARMGVVYGPSFQTITAIYKGSNQVFAQLGLPPAVEHSSGDYVLHPSLIDGALQACVGLMDGLSEGAREPRLPFTLESLRIVAPCTKEMTAWVRYSSGTQAEDKAVKLDIDVCDEHGHVCVQMRGLSTRVLSQESSATDAPMIGSLLAIPVWQASDLVVSAEAGSVAYAEHHVILCELSNVDPGKLDACLAGGHCVLLDAREAKDIAQRFSQYALSCFARIQSILQTRPTRKVLLQIVIAGDREQALLAGLSGLLKTAALEDSHLAGQLILVPLNTGASDLGRILLQEKNRVLDTLIRYEHDARHVLQWQEITAELEPSPMAFRDHGVYLISGGLGGLGILFAKEILQQTQAARVVLTGRSAPSAEKQALLDGLSPEARRLSYRQLDLGDLYQVKQLIAAIRAEYGQLNGIVHSAGMIADKLILKKSGAEFSRVLAPKVTGAYNLDQASQDVELDFFVLFSSVAAAMGNPGQADYAAANGFMDQLAAYRNRLVDAGQRHGRTRSINWPLWQAGGMGMDPATLELMQQSTGMQPMQTATGLQAFYRSLASPYDQMLVVEGRQPKIRTYYLPRTLRFKRQSNSDPAASYPIGLVETKPAASVDQLQQQLKTILAKVLQIEASSIDVDQAFAEFGLDSFLGAEMMVAVNKKSGTELSNNFLFDYPTVGELSLFLEQEIKKLPGCSVQLTAELAFKSPLLGAGSYPILKKWTMTGNQAVSDERVAIIGMSGRYPQAPNLSQYWDNLAEGRNSIVEMPSSRWNVHRYYDADRSKKNKTNSKWIGALDEIDCFDPLFFRISPHEADYIDPQQRLFLEESYKAFEDAGYSGSTLGNRKCGVYLGVSGSEYALLLAQNGLLADAPVTSNHIAIAAARIAYYLNLKGPAISVDTACSSSLVAIHLACQAILSGEIDMALAGGVCLWLTPESYISISQAGMFSPVGQCKTFDDTADGMVNADGVGALVLKRLSDAKADNDFVYGVIVGSGINQDGRTNGITAPSVNSQIELERAIYAKHKIDPETISYIEAHGTGTKLGDPIELEALATVFQEKTDKKNFCALGSVKSNIGHTSAAAGVAGVQKVLLSMQHRTLVPTLNVTTETSRFDFKDSAFYVCRENQPWGVAPGALRRAAVSSFGFSGTNAHMVIEEYSSQAETTHVPDDTPNFNTIVPLSARKPEQLRQKTRDLLDYLRRQTATVDLARMAYTLQVGREAMEERVGFIVSSVEQLREKLEAYVADEPGIEGVYRGQVRRNQEALSLFSSDVDLQQTIDKWMTSRKLPRLADLWVRGLEMDWNKLYSEGKPQRIPLPTYPFARERYWIPKTETAWETKRSSAGAAAEQKGHIDEQASLPLSQPRAAADLPVRMFPSTYAEYWKTQDQLLTKVLWCQLHSLGFCTGMVSSVSRWKEAIGLPVLYERWLDESIGMLVERGQFSYHGNSSTVTNPVVSDSEAVWEEWNQEKKRWFHDPELKAHGLLVESTLLALPEILAGNRAATDVIFPNSSMEMVKGVYQDNAVSDFFNEVLADRLVAYLDERQRADPGSRIRILEIGAGTGGSSALLLRRLQARAKQIEEYCYSDISKAFLFFGEKEYGPRNPFLTFRLFDIEAQPAGQGIAVGNYDVVIATNVLHATKNIRATLRNAKATIKRNGILLLNEMAERSLFNHLTFGLLKGWWLYEDQPLRIRGCPALSPETWNRVLQEEGFRSVVFPLKDAPALGQQIIVAESDGVLRLDPGMSRSGKSPTQPLPAKPVIVLAHQEMDGGALTDSVHAFLIDAVSQMMKVKTEDIDLDAELSQFGFDSITLAGFSKFLNEAFQWN